MGSMGEENALPKNVETVIVTSVVSPGDDRLRNWNKSCEPKPKQKRYAKKQCYCDKRNQRRTLETSGRKDYDRTTEQRLCHAGAGAWHLDAE
ncbi:MAG: hypothetical protein IJ056_04155 [Acidaminococcaceae bacterium]|nr:hypothetical protein [Acidaminococcaceae bacterium]